MESRSLPHGARHRHRSTHDFGESLDDGKPQAGPLFFLFTVRPRLHERFKDRIQFVLRNAHPGVLHLDDQLYSMAAVVSCFSHETRTSTLPLSVNLTALPTEVESKPVIPGMRSINTAWGKFSATWRLQLELLFCRWLRKAAFAQNANLAQIGRFRPQVPCYPPRLRKHVEDVIDEQKQRVCAGTDGLQILPVFRFTQIALQQFTEAKDGIHRRADFMAHVGQEDGLFLVAVFCLQLGFRQVAFAFLVSDRDVRQPQCKHSRADPKASRHQRGKICVKYPAKNFLPDRGLPVPANLVELITLHAQYVHHAFEPAGGTRGQGLIEALIAGVNDFLLQPDEAAGRWPAIW